MPYASKAQQALFHSAKSPVDDKTVQEYDDSTSNYEALPEYAKKKAGRQAFHAKLKDALMKTPQLKKPKIPAEPMAPLALKTPQP